MTSQNPTLTQLAATFRTPPRDYSPAPIWWWSGDRLDIDRLKWQLEQFAAGGVYNVVLLNLAPTGPLYGAEADDPEFFSEAWWTIFRGVCDHARAIGVRIWVYDQIGFSGANLQAGLVRDTPEWAGQWLDSVIVEGEGDLAVDCPGEGLPLAACITPLDADGRVAGPAERVTVDERRAAAVCAQRSRLRLIYAVRRGFDYTNAAACAKLIDTVHGEYERRAGEYFGDVIVGSFQDELPTLPTWSPVFREAFQAQAGYDLLDRIECLFEGEDDRAQRVRADTEAVRASLAEEAFFKPLFDWHQARNLICGFDQQGPARQGHPIASVGLYADYLRTHRWYGAPGSDHHGEAKVHASLAHLYDRPRVWIEAFHSSGWGGTLEETFDWLLPWLRAGATLYDPHAAYYSTRGGWWEWAPPSTCWRQPYWRHYPLFAAAVSRLCYALSQGHHVCDVGVLFPTTTVQANLTPEGPLPQATAAHDAYTGLVGLMTWYEVQPGALDRDRRDFDVLDDDSVQRAQVADRALVIGHERYSAIVLPSCTVLQPATAAMLVRFVEAGGVLVAVGATPERVAGDDAGAIDALRRLFDSGRAQRVATPDHIGAALATVPRPFDAPVPVLHRRVDGHDLVFVPAAFPRATELTKRHWLDITYTLNLERYQRGMVVRAHGRASAPMLWDPFTGERRVASIVHGAGYVDVTLPFDTGPAAVLVWEDEGIDSAPAPTPASTLEAMRIDGPWAASLEPALNNRYGDFDLPAAAGPPPLQTWHVQTRTEGEGEWRPATVTFGPHGSWLGPMEPSQLPPPLATAGDGDDPLGVRSWMPAVYSLSRGIERDPLHISVLGPKGRVPQEFLTFGNVPAGQAVRFRTSIWRDATGSAQLVIGAPAAKRAWVNGGAVDVDQPGYHAAAPITLRGGMNTLELELRAESPVAMRAFWALVADAAAFARPEWLTIGDAPIKDSRVRFARVVHAPFAPERARLHVGAAGACRVLVNGVEVGRQGGFDPYDGSPRVQRYETSAFRPGTNEVAVEVQDQGRPIALLVDAELFGPRGATLTFMGDDGWTAQRDAGPARPASLRRKQWVDRAYDVDAGFATGVDPGWPLVRRRPHPLPRAHWLEDGPASGVVLDVAPDAAGGAPRAATYRWLLPPMATRMHLPVRGAASLRVDGVDVPIADGWADLAAAAGAKREATLTVVPERGYAGGAAFSAPIAYEAGDGPIALGAWSEIGLGSYSGGVRYRTAFTITQAPARAVIDLGRVRGTAEVWLNGRRLGARFCSPYRFDAAGAVAAGENTLVVLVLNTLAPYLGSASPTHYIFPGQEVSGLFGPVTVQAGEDPERPPA